jgi:hypothetical protein
VRTKFLPFLFLIAFTISSPQEKPDYTPKFSGYIRAWYQADFSTNQGGYLIKQARLGIAGFVNEYAGYKFLVDFTRLGKLNSTTTTVNGVKVVNSVSASFSDVMLDAMAILSPFKNFEVTAGQFKVPFSTDNLKSDQSHEFANRPLLTSVSPNSRDIGFMMSYKIKGEINSEFTVGSFNGSGFNKPENDRSLDYAVRAVVTPFKDLILSASYYGGKVIGGNQNFIDLSSDYKYNSLVVGAEYVNKNLSDITGDITGNSYTTFVTYSITTSDGFLKEIIPAFRYEVYNPNTDKDKDEISRITVGLTFEFAKITFAHFRINYEKFDYKSGAANPDKLILEIQTRF